MKSSNDSGHAKNVANLAKYNQFIATLGEAYNPASAGITIAGLNTLQANAEAILTAANTALNNWQLATNKRELKFDSMDKFSTQLLAALQSVGATQQTIDDFTALVRQMRGSKITKADAGFTSPATPPTDTPASPSTAKLSFDNKVQHFTKMVLLLEQVPGYGPNESDFTIFKLKLLLAELTALNNEANACNANLKAARIARNTFFYAKGTGLVDQVKKSRLYIKSIYGSGSQQHHAAIAIPFFRVVPAKKAN